MKYWTYSRCTTGHHNKICYYKKKVPTKDKKRLGTKVIYSKQKLKTHTNTTLKIKSEKHELEIHTKQVWHRSTLISMERNQYDI